VVDHHEIIITQPGSRSVAVYFKPRGKPYFVAKNPPVRTEDFRKQAWEAATAKAQELGLTA
jgi:hypothetical protein